MDNINEAPVVAAATKVVAGLAKAGAKAAAKGGKVAAKTSKNVGKAASKMKRPNIKSYKDPKTGKVNLDKYRSDQAKHKQIKKDQASRTDMSDTKPDGPSDSRTKRGERKLKAIDKVTKKRDAVVKKRAQTASDVTNKAGEYAKKSISATSGAFGTSSFAKESKITFQQFIDKTP